MAKTGEYRARSGLPWLVCAALLLPACGGGGGESGSLALAGDNQAFTTAEDTPISDARLDVRGSGAFLLTMVTEPTLGSVNLFAGTRPTFSYDPHDDLNGTDSFTYQASNSRGETITLTVTIQITSVADPAFLIIPGASPREVREDQPLNIFIRIFDPDDDSELVVLQSPAHGTVSALDPVMSTVTYQPALNYGGPDSVTFAMRGPGGETYSPTTQAIAVIPWPDPPDLSVSAPPQPMVPGTLATLTCSATDVDSPPPTRFVWSGIPQVNEGGSVTTTQATFVVPAHVDGYTFQVGCGTAIDIVEHGWTSITLTAAPAPDLDGDREPDLLDPDDDADGYADFYETLLGFDPADGTSRPVGVDPAVLGVDFSADHDGDGIATWLEVLAGRDPLKPLSVPADTDRDGIPDVIDRNDTPDQFAPWGVAMGAVESELDVSSGNTRAQVDMTIGDQTGVQRTWSYLQLVSNTVTRRLVLSSDDALSGVLLAGRLTTAPISPYAARGTWRIIGGRATDILWNMDGASFHHSQRSGSIAFELSGEATIIDETGPLVSGFTVVGPPVDPGLGGQRLHFQITASDEHSPLAGAEVEFSSYQGRLWLPFSNPATSGTFDVYSDVIPPDVPTGERLVLRLSVYDTAGNITVLDRTQLQAAGFSTEFTIGGSAGN